MNNIIKYFLIVLVVIFSLDWIVMGHNFFLYKFFAPRQEAVRREVYENTKSYHQGNIQRLNSLCTEVTKTDDDHKALINDTINHEFAEWNMNDVPDYLHSCLINARNRR